MKKIKTIHFKHEPIAKDITPEIVINEPIKAKFAHEQLLEALYWCLDAFDRAGMLFFLVKNTAKQAQNNELLSGDKIEIGVRRLEWISGGKRILECFINDRLVKEEETVSEYNFNGVPVFITVYDDDECLESCDTIVYQYEFFKIPNPYERFAQLYE